jgi:hypothetical protein
MNPSCTETGGRTARSQRCSQQRSDFLSLSKVGSGCHQTSFFLTFAAVSSLLQDWYTSARNKQQVLWQQLSLLCHRRLWKLLLAMAGKFVSFCLLFSPCQLVCCFCCACHPSGIWILSSRVYTKKIHYPKEHPLDSKWVHFLGHVWACLGDIWRMQLSMMMRAGPASPGLVTFVLKVS